MLRNVGMQGFCGFLKTHLNLNYMFINLSHCDLSSGKMYLLLGNLHIHVKCSDRYCFVLFHICWLLFYSQVFMNLKFYFFNMCLLHWGDKKNMKLSLLNYLSLLLEWLWRLIVRIWFLPPPTSFFKGTQAISSASFCQTQYISFFTLEKLKTDICAGFSLCVTLNKVKWREFLW